MDLAIESCNRLGRHLIVIGDSEEQTRLRTMFRTRGELLGLWVARVPRSCRGSFSSCLGFLFLGEEDFG